VLATDDPAEAAAALAELLAAASAGPNAVDFVALLNAGLAAVDPASTLVAIREIPQALRQPLRPRLTRRPVAP
jgi:hypothetical protein